MNNNLEDTNAKMQESSMPVRETWLQYSIGL
jgi:hypothetical protein